MKTMLSILTGLAVWVVVPTAGAADKKYDLPKDAAEALRNAKEVELFSLDPENPFDNSKDGFHGWRVMGSVVVKDADQREQLVKEYVRGVEESKGVAAKGFKPRYGLRVTHEEKTFDIVASFDYLQSVVYKGDEVKGVTVRHTGGAAETFEKAVKDAKLKTADKK